MEKKRLTKAAVKIDDQTTVVLEIPKVDESGNVENAAYTNVVNNFTEPQELNLKKNSNYEYSEIRGKSSSYNKSTGFTSGTDSSYFVNSLIDSNNKIIADSTLQIKDNKVSAFLEVTNADNSTSGSLGITVDASGSTITSFAVPTTDASPDNAIVTKQYLETKLSNYIPSGSGTVSVSDATDKVKGIVLLSDSASTLDAATGKTAVTPKALNDVITAYKKADATLRNDLEQQIAQGGGGNLNYIITPTIINPTQDSTDQSTLINIIGSAFKSVFEDDTRISRQFQIATDSEFLSIVKDKEVNADSWVVEPPQLSDTTKYYVRIKDKASSGYSSSWSSVRTFTTGQGLRPADPVIILKGYNNSPTDILSGLVIETQPFSVPGGDDTHKATSWFIATKSRANVWESLNDTVNKTSITVPEGTLQKATEYTLTVVFHGTNYGDSNPVTVDFTTSSDFGTVNAPTLTVEGAPNNVYETPTLTGGAFSNTRDSDTHEMTDWEIVPTAEGEAVWQSLNNSSDKTSIVVPSGILQTSTAYTAKIRYNGTKYGWSKWTGTQFTTATKFAAISTPIISGPTTEVINTQIFTSSAFSMSIGGPGNHDKSDWIIVKANAPSVEIWSSKNDTTNLTTCPSLKNVLEVSTNYILKVRYHDSTKDIWSEFGTLAFTTKNEFSRYNYIGVPGTANFGVGLADEEEYTSLDLSPCENCETPNHFQYGLYTKTIQVQTTANESLDTPCYFKFIPKFYIKYLQNSNGVNLTSEELDATLPYVDVTKEQMQEAQKRSPKNAMVVASADKFTNKDEAQLQGFILPRGFIDGGVEKNGFFILNTLASGTGDGSKLTSLSFGVSSTSVVSTLVPLALHRGISVDTSFISNMQGNFYDAVDISKLVGDEFNCCSIFAWSIISILSLIQGQYTTSTEDCAWYDSSLTTNYPKGINNYFRDTNDTSVTATIGSDSETTDKPNTIVNTGYSKTTHNGSVTGITNVNGWMWQWCIGFGYQNSDYKYLGISHKISEITTRNVNKIYDISLGTKLNFAGFAAPNTCWGSSSKSSFNRDFTGNKWAMNGVYSYVNDSFGTNEFGNDYHLWSAGSSICVGGNWDNGSSAGVFRRNCDDWGYSSSSYGFRIIAYPV